MIIIISYFKPYNILQIIIYYQIEIVIWNYIIMYRFLELDRNIRNYKIVWNIFVLWMSIWYHISVARGVMVIVVGNEHGDSSSNPGRDWFHILGKGMNPIILPPTMGE